MSIIKPIVAALSLAPALALAAPATFDFYLDGGSDVFTTTSSAPGFVSGGIGLTVTAKKANGTAGLVGDRWDGLGVVSSTLDSSEIETNESLILTFSQAVNLSSLQLSNWQHLGLDKATLSVGSTTVNLGSNNSGLVLDTFSFSGLSGTQFILKGASTGLVSVTSFRLAGLTVSPVPEPGTWALMAAGLVGVAAVRARRRA